MKTNFFLGCQIQTDEHHLKSIALLWCLFVVALFVVVSGGTAQTNTSAQAFLHPGVLHTQSDFQRMRQMMATEPWKSGFEKLKSDPQSRADWRLRGPFADVGRDPGGSRHIVELDADSNAAYQNALMWCLTTNQAHARKAIEILNAWSSRLRTITGHDKELGASLCGDKLVNAAELLRHTDAGWQA